MPPPSRILVDPAAGRVLFEDSGAVPRHPASLVKLMTLFVVFHAVRAGRVRLTDGFLMTPAAAGLRGSRLGCAAGTPLSVDQAIVALAVASANDVALVLAEGVGGSVQGFVAAMNTAAKALRLAATRFATPHGLDEPGQFTTARDAALLAARLYLDFPEHRHVFARRSLTFGDRVFTNTNRLLAVYPGMNGMKTGTTRGAGCHLVASAERNGRHLISVVMGCATRAARDAATVALLDAGFAGAR